MGLVDYRVANGIAYVTLNRPEVLNAVSDEMAIELKRVLSRFDDDPQALVAILHGNGRAFCSGGDIKRKHLRPREELERNGGAAHRDARIEEIFYRYVNNKPLIAAVHGYALGAGLYFALLADMLVASQGTKFQVAETKRGVDATRFWALLRDRASGGFATDVAMTGRFWGAAEGFQRGMVDRLAAEGEHLTTAEELAHVILANPPLSVRATVKGRRGATEEVELTARLRKTEGLHLTEDFAEAAKAFAEKRKPRFIGK
jgi:enoyl-CoA hydratase/carnithine racemase